MFGKGNSMMTKQPMILVPLITLFVTLTDVRATCAAIVGAELPNDAAEDSCNMLSVLLGTQDEEAIRRFVLQQTNRHEMSIRNGQWKYLDHKGSGGNDYKKERLKPHVLKDTDPDAPGQLYNLKTDPGETNNPYSAHPELVQKLKAQLEECISSGRSAPLR